MKYLTISFIVFFPMFAFCQTELNPDGVSQAGGWTFSSGSIPANLDEGNPGDEGSSAIYNYGGSGQVIVTLDDVSDPNSSATHTLHAQLWSANGLTTYSIRLYQGSTIITTWAQPHAGNYVAYSHDLTTAEANSITDYNNLRIGVQHSSGSFKAISQVSLVVPDSGGAGYPNKVNGVNVSKVKGVVDPAKVIGS